jgi:hypothetical protein
VLGPALTVLVLVLVLVAVVAAEVGLLVELDEL